MLAIIFVYLIIGILLILFGPLAIKINEEIHRFKRDNKLRLEWDNNPSPKWKVIGFIVTLRGLGILFYPLLYGILIRDYFQTDSIKRDEKPMSKDENLLYFTQIGGAGNIICKNCDFNEKIVGFLHGTGTWTKTGFQCQTCGKFHSIKNVLTQTTDKNCDCSGNLERDKPIFCPKCKSKNVAYQMSYIT